MPTTRGRGQISHRETRTTTTTTQDQLGRQQSHHIHSTLAYQTSLRSQVRSYNTTQFHKIAGYTSTTSGTLSCRKHKHCFTQVRNQLNIKSLHPRLQPAHKSSTLQSSSHSPEDGQHRLTEISRHLLNLNSSFQNYHHMVLPQGVNYI